MWTLLLIPLVILVLWLLLRLPVHIRFFARLSAGTSRIRLELWLFGLIPVRRTLWLYLLDEPYFTLLYADGRGAFHRLPLTGSPKKKKLDWRSVIDFERVQVTYFVGLPDDAALTAFATGALATAGEYALRLLFTEVTSTMLPVFDRRCLRINLEGIASVIMAKSIRILLTNKARKT